MQLYIATADDRDYDAGAYRVLGVFSTRDKAEQACLEFSAAYNQALLTEHGGKGGWHEDYLKRQMEILVTDVDEVTLDEILK